MMVDTCNKFQFKLNCLQQREFIKSVSRQDQIVSESWSLQAKNEDGITQTIYNPNVHSDRAEDKYIGATVKYFDIRYVQH